jgi:hypothetical protein
LKFTDANDSIQFLTNADIKNKKKEFKVFYSSIFKDIN